MAATGATMSVDDTDTLDTLEGGLGVSYRDRFAPRREGGPLPASEPPAPTTQVATGRDYEAAVNDPTNRRTPARLRLTYGDGTIALMSYAYLVEVLCTSHQALSLIYTNVAITLEGRNLTQLIEPLQEEKLRALTCFNARRHNEPAADKPVITTITRQSLQDLAAKQREIRQG